MSTDLQQAMTTFILTQMRESRAERDKHVRRPVVAISRDHGAGGEEIGQALADRLQVDYFDSAIIDRICEAARSDRKMMSILDETVKDRWGAWLYALLAGEKTSPSEYLRHCVNAILGIAATGGVIMGRGANIVLRGRPILRVRIAGSVEICAQRLAFRDGGSARALAASIREINRERARFLWENYRARMNDSLNYDIVVNTDHFYDLTQVVELLLTAFRAHAAGKLLPMNPFAPGAVDTPSDQPAAPAEGAHGSGGGG